MNVALKPFAAIALAAAITLPLPGSAAPISLDQVLRQAPDNAPIWQAAEARYQAAQEVIDQALAAALPTLKATGSIGIDRKRTEGFGATTASTVKPRSYALTLNQPIYSGGRVWIGWTMAHLQADIAKSQRLQAVDDLIKNIVTAYLNWDETMERQRLAKRELEALAAHEDQLKARLEVGVATQTDLDRGIMQRATAEAGLVAVENQVHLAQRQFEVLVGQKIEGEPGNLAAQLARWALPDGSDIPELDAIPRGALVAKVLQQQLAEEQVSLEGSYHLPELSLQGQISRSEKTFSATSVFQDQQLTLNLTVPLYSGGSVLSKTRQAEGSLVAAGADLTAQRAQTAFELAQARLDILSKQQEVTAKQAAVTAAQSLLDGVQQGFDVGTQTSVDLLDAHRDLFSAELNLTSAQHALLLARLNLAWAMGGLEARLGLERN
ncbi:MAG: hypothetical protein COX57_08740 [Alphaproteobacteria bacterium CG_4_10_14_0_2_um_filter_63_37]|nr:MAG: hypothetical protein AUJ55_06315 [Proteobacteria bacterium CG1_02_64_396]PJA24377.1 MAG: hypothetical protein COX57_08740 [Alphaproteobacteria bacterium CG_4_10_14_0_2_um_filter_63_37]